MAIFNSYVSLPEGKGQRSEKLYLEDHPTDPKNGYPVVSLHT